MSKVLLNLFFVLVIFSSCTMEPKYTRPEAPVSLKQEDENKRKITKISWQELFISPDLQRVVQLALDNNRDLKIANLNIENARANYGIVRSNLLPSINAVAYETRQGVPSSLSSFTPNTQYRVNLALSAYEIDFFGRLRSLKKSALENFLATEQARNVTRISLISGTINAYAQYLADVKNLKLADENLAAQTDRYKFSELRYKNGLDSKADLMSAQAKIENIKLTRETYAKLVALDKTTLMSLTGIFDEKILPQQMDIDDIKINEDLLDFVPSESLLTRPDIMQAEHNLKSANANIGAARAAFFPSITITGNFGYASNDLSSLWASQGWSYTPQINLPIFAGGRNMANLKMANILKNTQIINYEKAIQNAFKEVSDQLSEREFASKQLESSDKIFTSRKKNYEFGEAKLKVGINSKADVIDLKLTMITAQQNWINAKKDYIANVIDLYKAMGGGSEIQDDEEL